MDRPKAEKGRTGSEKRSQRRRVKGSRKRKRCRGIGKRKRCRACKKEERSSRQEEAANTVIVDIRACTEDHARSQRTVDGQPVHFEHQRVEADCHCHIPTVL